jgi:hypothetical protein
MSLIRRRLLLLLLLHGPWRRVAERAKAGAKHRRLYSTPLTGLVVGDEVANGLRVTLHRTGTKEIAGDVAVSHRRKTAKV